MKKIFSMAALFAAGLLGFTSCSNDDVAQGGAFSQDALAVSFAAVKTNGAVTPAKGPLLSRAAGVTTTNLTNIYVQATNSENAVYFGTGTAQDPMELFTYDGSSEFRSTVNHYWPNNTADGANNTLNFYASNQQEALTAGTQANPSPIVDDYECDGIKDWVTATVKAGEKTIPYPLTFQHVLSQIKITAEAKDKTQDLVYKVVGVKLSAPDTGDYQFANATAGVGTWTIDNSSSANYTYEQNMNGQFNPTAATEAEQTWASTDYFNILPVTSGTLTFDVQYQVIQNGQVIGDFTGANSKQVTVDAPNLLSGKIYTYNFVLAINTNDVITFTVNTTAWGSGSTTDVQVPYVKPEYTVSWNNSTFSFRFSDAVGGEISINDLIDWGSYDVYKGCWGDSKLKVKFDGTVYILSLPAPNQLPGYDIAEFTFDPELGLDIYYIQFDAERSTNNYLSVKQSTDTTLHTLEFISLETPTAVYNITEK